MSDHAKKNAVDNLLREGSADYLDALYALHRFNQAVQDRVVAVWNRHLEHLVSAVGIKGPTPDSIEHYCQGVRLDSDCDGNYAWIGGRVWFPEPWEGHCHLGLDFDRGEGTAVSFCCDDTRPANFAKLKLAFQAQDQDDYYFVDEKYRVCGFAQSLANPAEMEAELEKMMEYAVNAWERIGGWRRLRSRA